MKRTDGVPVGGVALLGVTLEAIPAVPWVPIVLGVLRIATNMSEKRMAILA